MKRSCTGFYFLQRAPSPWGDYGLLLEHGLGMMNRERTALHLRRAGPYIYPITMPFGEVVINDGVHSKLVSADLIGLRCVPVIKDKIVAIDWQQWDRSKRSPAFYPENGSPVNYIECGAHSEKAAKAMGPLWAIDLPVVARVVRPRKGDVSPKSVRVDKASLSGVDFAVSRDVLWPIMSIRAVELVRDEAGDRIRFEPCIAE